MAMGKRKRQRAAELWIDAHQIVDVDDHPVGRAAAPPSIPTRKAAPSIRALPTRARSVYGECMARLISTTVRLDEEDVRALKRARAAGH